MNPHAETDSNNSVGILDTVLRAGALVGAAISLSCLFAPWIAPIGNAVDPITYQPLHDVKPFDPNCPQVLTSAATTVAVVAMLCISAVLTTRIASRRSTWTFAIFAVLEFAAVVQLSAAGALYGAGLSLAQSPYAFTYVFVLRLMGMIITIATLIALAMRSIQIRQRSNADTSGFIKV
jgi:hypothetical protein